MRRVAPYGHLDRLTICTTQATMRQSINQWSPEWTDDTTPRTDNPVRFLPYMGVSVTYRMRFHWPA